MAQGPDPSTQNRTPDQEYLDDLFKKAQAGGTSAEQKIMVEMLAESEVGIARAMREIEVVEDQVKDLQAHLERLRTAIINERGKARGLMEALLKLRA